MFAHTLASVTSPLARDLRTTAVAYCREKRPSEVASIIVAEPVGMLELGHMLHPV